MTSKILCSRIKIIEDTAGIGFKKGIEKRVFQEKKNGL